jgi:hypothetical protein
VPAPVAAAAEALVPILMASGEAALVATPLNPVLVSALVQAAPLFEALFTALIKGRCLGRAQGCMSWTARSRSTLARTSQRKLTGSER